MGADVTAMIKGLQTHNAALVTAAADGFHANAMDVSGNNVPLNGGTFNADGTTIADALSTATGPLPAPPATLLTPSAPAAQVAANTPAPAPALAPAPAAGGDAVDGIRRASLAVRRDGAPLSPHVGITAGERGLRRLVK